VTEGTERRRTERRRTERRRTDAMELTDFETEERSQRR
jgi:hypothetical protein